MTRETKIGMAIATTFLSLVGLVVTSKMRQPDAPAESKAAVRTDQAKPAAEESSAPPLSAQTPGNGIHAGLGSEAPAGQPTEPVGGGDTKKRENEAQWQQDLKLATSGLPAAPAISEPLRLQPAGGPAPLVENNAPASELPAIDSTPLPINSVNEPKRFGAMPLVTDPPVAPAPIKASGITEPGIVGLPQPPPIALQDPPVKEPPANDLFPKEPPAKDLFPKEPPAKELLPAKSIGLPEVPPLKEKPGNAIQPPPAQPTDPLKQKLDTPLPGNLTTPEKKGIDPMPPPLTPGGTLPPVPPALKSESIGTIGNTGGDIHITAPLTPGSPGQSPAGGVPLLTAANNNLPKVTTYEEKTHVIQPGVTSFDALSKTLYDTPDYGKALLEYNRQHIQATAGVKQDPPVLQPNQQIYFPPKNMLEIQYPQFIQHSAAAPAAPAAAVKISAPTPLIGPGSVSGTNPPTADATVAFHVAQPQFIYDIARQQLGDGLLWPEILRLNPALHTDQPIPAGTELRLPKASGNQ